jgi:ribonuclease D
VRKSPIGLVPFLSPPFFPLAWRADFVGRLFDDLLAGKLSIRVGDAKSDHPLVFEPKPD